MDISKYTAEDFVLDPSFRKWILRPDAGSNLMWEELLAKYPSKLGEIEKGREILRHLSVENHLMEEEEDAQLWKSIEKDIGLPEADESESKIIPLQSKSVIEKSKQTGPKGEMGMRWLKVATISFFVLTLGTLWTFTQEQQEEETNIPVVYEERTTAPGIKTQITLSDGTVVLLNSSSQIRYIKHFEKNTREVFLEGEAFFNVAKDSLRPFVVHIGEIKTKVLGTSFNIKAYKGENLDISLLSGKVEVDVAMEHSRKINLLPGEALKIDFPTQMIALGHFDEEVVMGWTRKTIIFQETPLQEAVRVLENWYGVKVEIINRPPIPVKLSGRFENETLTNVLEGLCYASGFEYKMQKDKITIKFKPK
ncbi:FecR family protein [Negadavirga shengliensis]|uniref:FecR family protein n=1 Tax=Negadavirga shengliensis TaxID=1389218 RepID=A0ABV9SWZ5_9BACT